MTEPARGANDSVRVTRAVCPLCSSHDNTLYLHRQAADGDYVIVRCEQCGLIFLREMPSANALDAFYNSTEYFDGAACGYDKSYFKQRASIERESARRLRQIEALLAGTSLKAGRTLLDVGCAAGFFLRVAQARGWRVSGIEVSRSMAAYASRLLGVEIKNLFDVRGMALDAYEVVTLWEVVEHLTAPLPILRKVGEALAPGGLVALSTPNTGHWHAQRHPEWWSEFKPPAHVVYFTETTLRDLLTRAGFENIIIRRTRALTTSPQTMARLRKLSALIGDGADRKTPLWFLTSFVYRLVTSVSGAWHHWQYPNDDLYVGLEAYACKPRGASDKDREPASV